MRELSGKSAVVTGAASGIGLALTRELLAEDMSVVMADIEEPALVGAAEGLADTGRVHTVVTDVADPESVQNLADAAVEHMGSVELVCANAGVGAAGTVEQIPLEDWQWVMGVNLFGPVHCVNSFLPVFRAQGGEAHLAITASTLGLMSSATASAPYVASKHAAVSLAESLFLQLAGSGIGVSCLCPDMTATNIFDADRNRPGGAVPKSDEAEARAQAIRAHIAASMDPAEVARCLVEAVVENRFWAIPTTGADEPARIRTEGMLARRNPTP